MRGARRGALASGGPTRMRNGAPMAESTARDDEGAPGLGAEAAAVAAVLAVSPAAQALFDDAGRCAAASPAFSRRAAAGADPSGRLSPDFLAAADVKDLTFAGRLYRLVTLPPPAEPAPEPAL